MEIAGEPRKKDDDTPTTIEEELGAWNLGICSYVSAGCRASINKD